MCSVHARADWRGSSGLGSKDVERSPLWQAPSVASNSGSNNGWRCKLSAMKRARNFDALIDWTWLVCEPERFSFTSICSMPVKHKNSLSCSPLFIVWTTIKLHTCNERNNFFSLLGDVTYLKKRLSTVAVKKKGIKSLQISKIEVNASKSLTIVSNHYSEITIMYSAG